MRVLVTGSRFWASVQPIVEALDALQPDTVIEGGARGADAIARAWALDHEDIFVETYTADWGKHGNSAGPKRNTRMLDEGKPDLVLAFAQDLPQSRGTADCVQKALLRDLPVAQFDGETWHINAPFADSDYHAILEDDMAVPGICRLDLLKVR